jgi:hypothetical protein
MSNDPVLAAGTVVRGAIEIFSAISTTVAVDRSGLRGSNGHCKMVASKKRQATRGLRFILMCCVVSKLKA